MVSSSNDPWITSERAEQFSKKWGSDFLNIGEAGHINTASGYGNWKDIFVILHKLQKTKHKKS